MKMNQNGYQFTRDLISLKNRLKPLKIELSEISKLKPNEDVDKDTLFKIKKDIIKEGIKFPIVVDKNNNIILDGHHRFNIFKALEIQIIPVFYIDYFDYKIVLDSWNGHKITKNNVIKIVNSGKTLPRKTTKHMFLSENGLVHISSIVPRIDLDIFELRRENEKNEVL